MKDIIIEAGHHFFDGRPDPGAMSDGYKEAYLTRHAKERIAYYLNKFYPQIKVYLDDDYKTLSQVIAWVKSIEGNNSLVYSLHWNAAANRAATGAEAFVANNASQQSFDMARRSLDVITKISGLRDRGVKTESQSAIGSIGILNSTVSPATLLEFGFISNEFDRETFFEWQEEIYITLAHEFAYQALK